MIVLLSRSAADVLAARAAKAAAAPAKASSARLLAGQARARLERAGVTVVQSPAEDRGPGEGLEAVAAVRRSGVGAIAAPVVGVAPARGVA
jgi:hypothetical protein